jgi:hypothetical protein
MTDGDQQLNDMDDVIATVGRWTGGGSPGGEVGSAIEPPLFSAVRNVSLLRAGVNGFLQVLSHRNHSN